MRRIDRFPGHYLARFTEAVLIALIGLQCTSLYGVAATPPPAPRTGAAERTAQPASPLLSSYDPFSGALDAGSAPAIASTDLELHGIRQDGRSGGGSAIISHSDGPQRSFGIGDAIAPGLVLKAVGSGYATIARHGMEERLQFAGFDAPPSGAGPRASVRPPPRVPAGSVEGRSSINFADPSTLPASLTSPVAQAAGASDQGPVQPPQATVPGRRLVQSR